MRSTVISLALATFIGVVIGLLLQSPENSPPPSTISTLTVPQSLLAANVSSQDQISQLNELTQQLQQEIIARQALQKQVSVMSSTLAALSADERNTASPDKQGTPLNPLPTVSEGTTGNAWFNKQALIDAGMGSIEAEQLKNQYEELELEKLYLRDTAVREGWARGNRYRTKLQELDQKSDGIKQELSEEVYDAYLFAAGQSNRVAVQSVLSGSTANKAGFEPGDQIIRYNGQRIYNWRDLREATTQGDVSETIPIEIERDGQRTQYYVQRGPLGIRMTSVSIAP